MPSDGDLFPPKIPATKWFNVYCETPKHPSSFPLLFLPLIHSRRQLEASPSPLRQPCPRSWKIISSNEVVKSSEFSLSFCLMVAFWFSFHWIFLFPLWIARSEIYLKGFFLVLVWVSVALLWKFLCLEFLGCWCFWLSFLLWILLNGGFKD